MEQIKIKPLTKEQLLISASRLTRFKYTEIKYLRVFKDIIIGNLIYPKYKKQELDEFDYETVKDLAEKIINFSLCKLGIEEDSDYLINQRLYDYENAVFKINQQTEKLLKNKINYKGITKLFAENEVNNLRWLKALGEETDLTKAREKNSLHFPVEKVIICEGITEETLLPVFGEVYGFNFDKNGVHIISAGGKNQVVKTYYELSEYLRLPIFILLDRDAEENLRAVNHKLREIDEVYILASGEFEDLLPQSLVERTLGYAFENISLLDINLLDSDKSRVKILEEIFKTRGLHEFKKAEFANLVKINIQNKSDLSDEIIRILEKITANKKELI